MGPTTPIQCVIARGMQASGDWVWACVQAWLDMGDAFTDIEAIEELKQD